MSTESEATLPILPVVGVERSPLNRRRWALALSCGHDAWVTCTGKPLLERAPCVKVRTLMADPDFRRQPKTGHSCWYCQRDLVHGAHDVATREVFVIDACLLLHPDHVATHAAGYREPTGWLAVGLDCARRIGMEWSRPFAIRRMDGRGRNS